MTHKEAHKAHASPATRTYGCPFCIVIERAEAAARKASK